MGKDVGAGAIGFSRRAAIAAGGGAIGGLMIPGLACADDFVVAETARGRVRGVRDRGISVFLGIPYAGSVSGAARFRAPPPPTPWTGVRDALTLGPPSIQPPNQTSGINEPAPAEDCLVLNIWTPAADGGKRPVMFYSHGGGFTTGSGGAAIQDGGNLAREYDVVVVETNHRLGLLGYLYLKDILGPDYPGNQGLMDLVAGLKWVNENIGAFGGDPRNVMIWGESGGGMKTIALYAMEAAAPYFNKASVESPAGGLGRNMPDRATAQAHEVLKRLGIAPADARNLLEVPAAALLKAQSGDGPNVGPGIQVAGAKPTLPPLNFGPVIDGTILTELPFDTSAPAISADKPLIMGGCKDESVFIYSFQPATFSMDEAGLKTRLEPMFGDQTDAWIDTFRHSRPADSPAQLFIAITTATPWRAFTIHAAELKAAQGRAPAYAYILDYESTAKIPGTNYPIGSPHAADIEMKFDTTRRDPKRRPFYYDDDQSPARFATAHNMSEMWTTYARTGKPGAKGQPDWVPYSVPTRPVMMIDAACHIVDDPEHDERVFFQSHKPPEHSLG